MKRVPNLDGWRGVAALMAFAAILASSLVELDTIGHIIPRQWSDLYALWMGVRAALTGTSPYSHTVIDAIQRGFYGHALSAVDPRDQKRFAYPALLIPLIFPLGYLRWAMARLVFIVISPLLVTATAFLWAEVCDLHLRGMRLAVALLFTAACWPAMWAYQQQQVTVLVIFATAAACFLLKRGYDLPAAIFLATLSVKPQVTAPVVLCLLLLAISQRRWRFLATFWISLALLFGISEILVPGWIPGWIATVRAYGPYTHALPIPVMLLGPHLGRPVTALICICLCFVAWKARKVSVDSSSFGKVAAFILSLTCVVVPVSIFMIYDQLMLVPAVLLLFFSNRGARSNASWGLARVATLCSISIVPICAAFSLATGFHRILAVLPFLTVPLPVFLAVALAFHLRKEACAPTMPGHPHMGDREAYAQSAV